MKPLPILLTTLITAGACHGQSFSETLEWSAHEVENARRELEDTRESLLAEKRPKLEELTRMQSAVLALRRERDSLSTRAAGEARELERREMILREFEQNLAYVSGRLDRLRGAFEESLHTAELAVYRELLLAPERADHGGRTDAGLVALEWQWDLVTAAAARLSDQIGGGRFEASVTVDGVSEPGSVLQIGPYAYFSASNGDKGGVVRRGRGLEPKLHPAGTAGRAQIERALNSEPARLKFDPTLGQAYVIAESRVGWWEHVQRGGWWMIPIVSFGIVSAAIGIAKYAAVRKLDPPTSDQVEALANAARRNAVQPELDTALAGVAPAIRPIFSEGHAFREAPEDVREAAMHQAFIGFRYNLEQRLGLISLTAAIAPLLGLLGTVTGMIKTFQLISLYGTGDARALSGGISEALITTEYGLIVAIPALLLYATLNRRIRRITIETAAQIDRFNKTLSAGPRTETV